MRHRFVSLLIMLLIPVATIYAQKRAFTIQDLYRIKSVSDVHISPDGKSVIYAVSTPDLARAKRASHIWMMDLDGRNNRQLTQGEASASSPLFSPDGRWIAFISSKDGS